MSSETVVERRDDYLIRIRPRPDRVHVSQGRAVLGTDLDGFVRGGADGGLFVHETRLLSRYVWTLDGHPWTCVASSNVAQHSWMGYYVALPPGSRPAVDEGSGHVQGVAIETVELRLSRRVGRGLHEDVEITNYSMRPIAFDLELEVDADFADQEETRSERRQHGEIERAWRESERGWEIVLDYRAEHRFAHPGHAGTAHIHRGVHVRFENYGSPPRMDSDRVRFRVELAPQATWHTCVELVALIEEAVLAPGRGCANFGPADSDQDQADRDLLADVTSFTTSESDSLAPVVIATLEQAKHDLVALRLQDLDEPERAWTVAAGLPAYVALFGRDTLTASLQSSLLGHEMMVGTLLSLARVQGRKDDDWRDEQPGRMLHEAHTGPLATLQYNPRQRYYGSATTSGFYPVVVAELWHWTGDRELVRPFVRPALDALEWLDERSPRSSDGFYQYQTRSTQGTQHQGWKDSQDGIVDHRGRPVAPPVATCEEQAFVYVAKLHLSEVLWWLDEKEHARRLFHEAEELKKRFNDRFWMADQGFLAMGLGPDGELIRSIASNAGHCLAAGIVDASLAEQVATRLLADDLFSGWGIRTLSATHPAYNPYSYHRGSVWPVEQGSFALGFMRYGLHDQVERICRATFEAARLFDFHRLPEVFGGQPRDDLHAFPSLYAQTNSPQAWSASTVFLALQSMLGLYPYAPMHILLVDPHLPSWLPEITLRNLRVGSATVTLRFWRKGERSECDVVALDGPLHVVRQPSPWSITAGFAERARDLMASLVNL